MAMKSTFCPHNSIDKEVSLLYKSQKHSAQKPLLTNEVSYLTVKDTTVPLSVQLK